MESKAICDPTLQGLIKITPIAPNEFQFLEALWGTPYGRTFPSSGPSFTTKVDPVWLEFCIKEGLDPMEDVSCYKVRARLPEVKASIQKMDVPRMEPSEDVSYRQAFEFVKAYLGGMKGSLDWNDVEFTSDTSPGLPYLKVQQGRVRVYPDKRTTLDSGFELVKSFIDNYQQYPLIDTCNPKDEFLDISDLKRGKLRTTFGASVHKIMMESACFSKQNKWLIDHNEDLWIKYGSIKQYSGFDRMCKSLTHDFVWDSDCSGWDRVTCLDIVYKLRSSLWSGQADDWQLFWYLAEANTRPTFVSPVDGNIYRRQTGVSSGSYNTTSDNCIKHLFIVFHLLIRLSKQQNVSHSIGNLLDNADFLIYSDDKTGSLNLSYWKITPEEFLEFEANHYALYGLVIKPGSQQWSVRDGDIIDSKHSFLGSYFHWDPEYLKYEPYPRIGKIASSVAMWKQDYTPFIFIAKILALTILAKPEARLFQKYSKYLDFLVDKYDAQVEIIRLKNLITGGDAALTLVYNSLMYGFESRVVLKFFFPILSLIINEYENLKIYHMNNETVSMITPIHPVPPSSGIAKGRDTVKALLARGRMNANDVAYLTARTDPFHDKDINGLRGSPDGVMDPSICQFVTKTITLKRPSFVPTNQTWKFMVHTAPFLNRVPLVGCWRYGKNIWIPDDAPVGTAGHINVDFAADSQEFDPYRSGEVEPLCPKLSMGNYGSRLLGCGIEIRYTGSDLNNGGNLYGEMYPQYPCENITFTSNTRVGANWTNTCIGSYVPMKKPPRDVGYITTDPRHKSWRVTEGAFMTLRVGDPGQAPHMPIVQFPLLTQGGFPVDIPADPTNLQFAQANGSNVWDPNGTALPYSYVIPTPQNNFTLTVPPSLTGATRNGPIKSVIHSPQELGMIIGTGLHPDATLSLRVNWFIQNIPDVSETDFMSISKMPPFRNEIVFELCSRILQSLPIMVVLAENEGGTWWDRILNAISMVAPALGMIPHPLAKAASAAIPLMVQGGKMVSAASKVPKPPPPPPKKKKVVQPPAKPKNKK